MLKWIKRLFGPSSDDLLDTMGFGPNSTNIFSTNNVNVDELQIITPALSAGKFQRIGLDSHGDLVFRIEFSENIYVGTTQIHVGIGNSRDLIVTSLYLIENSIEEQSLYENLGIFQ